MQDTVTIRETFSSRDDAEAARERLEHSGFARNSMNITRIGDQFELAVHTRPGNRQRAEECINASDIMFEARRYGRQISEHAPSAGQSMLLVGVLAAVAGGLYYAFRRQGEERAARYSSGRPSTGQSLYRGRDEDQRRRDDRRFESGRPVADRSPGLRSDATGYGA